MSRVHRLRLAVLPTPLVAAPRLSDRLGIEVWIKRDDLTGVGMGGNKARPLEYLLGDARAAGADCLITGGGPTSNWLAMAAIAAARCGLETEIAMFGTRVPSQGNLRLLDRTPGVRITWTGDPSRASVDPLLDDLAGERRRHGGRPYVVGRGGATAIGALGYYTAVAELDSQLEALEVEPRTIWLPTGSCGTQAGLVAGHRRSGRRRRIVGVSVHRPVDECRYRIEKMSTEALKLVEGEADHPTDWDVVGDQLDPQEADLAAASELAIRCEAMLLDPEFGAPAMAELSKRAGTVEDPVVFLATGGAANLFVGSET